MKLLNYTSAYFAGILLIIITIWAAVFYYSLLDEIYDSIDDGLDNQKGLIIQKAAIDTAVLDKNDFDETDYAIREIKPEEALNFQDTYIDTMMYMQNEKSDEPVRLLKTVFLQNGRYYQLQVATSMVEEDDLVTQLFYSICWLYLGLMVTIILFNNFLLKKIWRPFYQLMRQLKNFRVDKPKPVTTPKTSVDEFKLLNETVQKLLKRNTDIYNSQKSFIENASHELQTPLAISINKLEALAENHHLKGGDLELLASALDHLERLARLNKSLLLLSRIENKQFTEEKLVDLNQLAQKIVVDFADQSNFSDIEINILEKDRCTQQMNEDMATILLTNLVKNAIVHNIPSGFVNIIIEKNALIVENTGVRHPLDEQKIFSRFHSGESSPTSTGLGLAIVKAIADLYQLNLSYHYDQQHRISVFF